MHESNLRFEHCYRLDMDAKIAPPHREHCWRDWTETYASGQPLDRIEYARRRISQLESGDTRLLTFDTTPHEKRVFEELPNSGSQAPMAAPAPTSAHEPPPKTEPVIPKEESAPEEPSQGGATQGANATSPHPAAVCSARCDATFDACTGRCGRKTAACAACTSDYRRCMRRCFQ